MIGNEAKAEESHNYLVMGHVPNPSQTAFVDSSSIKKHGSRVTYWTVWIYGTPRKFSSATVSYFARKNTDDCLENLNNQVEAVAYDSNGKQLTVDGYGATAAVRVVPKSVGEAMHNFVCFGKIPFDVPQTTIRTIEEARQGAQLMEAFQ